MVSTPIPPNPINIENNKFNSIILESFQRHLNSEHSIGYLGEQNENSAVDNNFSPVEKGIIKYLSRCNLKRRNTFVQNITNSLKNHNTLGQI